MVGEEDIEERLITITSLIFGNAKKQILSKKSFTLNKNTF
jgi:hypothetical protein